MRVSTDLPRDWNHVPMGRASTPLRPAGPSSLDEARAVVARFVDHYNSVRLHSAIGYVTPNDFLAGNQNAIWAERDRKLEAARESRRLRRAAARGGQLQPVLQ
jgi:transposase InsO family protein